MPVLSSNPSSVVSAGAWLTTGNVYTSDNTYATNTGATQNTEYPMEVGGFNFSAIPADATIVSVTVTIEIKTGTNNRAQVKGELFDGTTALTPILALTNLSATDTNYTFTPTATLAQLKSANLKVRITNKRIVSQASTTSLDYVKIDVNYTVNPKTSTIIDTFNTQIDPATWPTVAGNAVWEAGRVKTESLGAYSSISTAYAYDATDSSVFAKIVPPPGRNSRETILGLRTGAANDDGAYILVSGGPNARSLIYRRREGQTNYDTSESNGYDPAKHAYVRIRMSGTTQFKYDYSPDGTTWTDSGVTQTTAMNMTACRVALICGQWAAEPDTGFAYFDNVNTAGAPAKIGTLTDDFATSIDLYKWTVDDYNAPVVWEAGQVKMSCAISNYSWLTSLQGYDLRESSVWAKMTPPAQGRASREFNLRLGNNVNVNRVYFIITNDPKQFAARVRMNSVSTDSTWVPYDPVAYQWVRVRLTGTTMYWDVSPDGNTWNPFWSTTVDPSLFSSVTVAFECGQWQTEVDTGSGYVDNVNVLGVTGRPKVWTGSEYVQKPGKYWNGSAWVEKPWKEWDGSSWKTVK